MNIFEQASRKKLRFSSIKGLLTVEQLWDLPLSSNAGFDLDNIAKTVNVQLKSVTEESFVITSTNPAKTEQELLLEIVKHVISVKLEEAAMARESRARASERERLTNILAQKKDAADLELTPAQLEKKIKALST